MVRLGNDWDDILKGEFESPYYLELREFLKQEYSTRRIYPPMNDIFNALRYTSYKDTHVVILGQDPYHGAGQAHGLCFSVQAGVKFPPSLQNIFKELNTEYGITDLTPIASLKKLKYLELFKNGITDISPLAECTALEDINISYTSVSDITPLLGLNLKNIWITTWRLKEGQRALLYETFPDAKICPNHRYATGGGWRKLPNYYAQRDILGMFYMSSDL